MALLAASCITPEQDMFETTSETVESGSFVALQNKKTPLHKGNLKVGDDFVKVANAAGFDIKKGVSIVNIVPSIDTPVCETQTHILGETGGLDPRIQRITISRDLPMAQERFAKAAQLTNIDYYSDYKDADFGKSTGLLIKGPELLARAVVVTDANGIVKHLQIVPDVAQLPDMDKAISIANQMMKR